MNKLIRFIRYIFGADLMQLLVEENLHGNSAPLTVYLHCANSAGLRMR